MFVVLVALLGAKEKQKEETCNIVKYTQIYFNHLCLDDLEGDTFLCDPPLRDRSDL